MDPDIVTSYYARHPEAADESERDAQQWCDELLDALEACEDAELHGAWVSTDGPHRHGLRDAHRMGLTIERGCTCHRLTDRGRALLWRLRGRAG